VSLKRNVGWLVLVLGVLLAIYLPVIIQGLSPKQGLDLEGGVSITMQAMGDSNAESMDKAAQIIRNRINALGLTEPVVAAEGNSRVLVQVPGEKDIDRVVRIIGSTAQLQFREVLQILRAGEADYDSTPVTQVDPTDEKAYQELKGQEIVLEKREGDNLLKVKLGPTELTGDIISDAQAARDDKNGGWKIDFQLKDAYAKEFADLTEKLTDKQLAIVLDYRIESYPTVKDRIEGGNGEITGSFTKQEAQDLALVLRMGALPVDFRMERSELVSPTLGRESLRQGLIAGIVGLILVVVYMLLVYRGLGCVALLQLLLFGLLAYGIISLLGELAGWTLTLSGIAGIIVSIGISADSSVVYFERLKEEVREGRSLRSSADRAYKSAFRTIIAADFSTFIAAVILFWLALGPVRGFAFTLGLSTVLDVFISYFFTHNIVVLAGRLKPFERPAVVGVGRELKGGEA
jgi:preprotein translocase subunit SecD